LRRVVVNSYAGEVVGNIVVIVGAGKAVYMQLSLDTVAVVIVRRGRVVEPHTQAIELIPWSGSSSCTVHKGEVPAVEEEVPVLVREQADAFCRFTGREGSIGVNV
jgi:hypothetical protein